MWPSSPTIYVEEILSDFTNDRQQTAEAMARLRIAGFSESNMFDALVDTEQRMQDIEGRKAIVLISSGIDTFSKLTLTRPAVRYRTPAFRSTPSA